MLTREPISIETDHTDTTFAEQVHRTLGYNVFRQKQKDDENAKRLKNVLDSLDIMPFSAGSVAKYKQNKKYEGLPNKAGKVCLVALICLASTLVVWAIAGLAFAFDFVEGVNSIVIGSLAGASAAIFIVSLVVFGVESDNRVWKTVGISKYERPIPEFVLQTALDIKEKLHCADLLIEEMVIEEKIDPFLIVSYMGIQHYIEVWNEPGFKAKREV